MCVGIRKQSVVGYLLVVSGLAMLKSSPFQNDPIPTALLYCRVSQFVRFCDHDVGKHAILTTIKPVQWAPLGSHIRERKCHSYDDMMRWLIGHP